MLGCCRASWLPSNRAFDIDIRYFISISFRLGSMVGRSAHLASLSALSDAPDLTTTPGRARGSASEAIACLRQPVHGAGPRYCRGQSWGRDRSEQAQQVSCTYVKRRVSGGCFLKTARKECGPYFLRHSPVDAREFRERARHEKAKQFVRATRPSVPFSAASHCALLESLLVLSKAVIWAAATADVSTPAAAGRIYPHEIDFLQRQVGCAAPLCPRCRAQEFGRAHGWKCDYGLIWSGDRLEPSSIMFCVASMRYLGRRKCVAVRDHDRARGNQFRTCVRLVGARAIAVRVQLLPQRFPRWED